MRAEENNDVSEGLWEKENGTFGLRNIRRMM